VKKQIRIFQYCCCAVIFFLLCGAFLPLCGAQTCTTQSTTGEKTSQELTVINVKNSTTEDEDFFNFAIIWGTFEEKIDYFPLFSLIVRNPYPWHNRTMYVIGYQNWVHQWVFKKSFQIECGFLHIGIVGFHRLFVVAYGNIAAF